MMSKTTKAVLLSLSFLLATFVVAGGLGVKASTSSSDDSYKQLGVYSEVLSRIRTEYVEDPNISSVTSGALHGLLESLDADSSYLSASEYQVYRSHKAEARGDIGAAISKRFGYASVISVIPGGPSDKAGIQAADIFEAIDNKSTRDMSLAEIHNLLSGQPGSNISVSVVRARRAEPEKVVITRDIVVVPAASGKLMDGGIGYIQVDGFTKGKAQEIAARIKDLEKSGAKKLLLDVRNCAEGEETEGIATANLFLNHGTITYLQGQKYPREAFNADPSKAITSLPVAVLVNRGTAGPGELVAAALLENARADVVGDKTFGEGSVQKLIDLPDGAALILSVAKYYSPSGKAIQDAAVTPNVVVADVDDDSAIPDQDDNVAPADQEKKPTSQQDEQLDKAVQVLKSRS